MPRTALRTPSPDAHCVPETGTCSYVGMMDLVDCSGWSCWRLLNVLVNLNPRDLKENIDTNVQKSFFSSFFVQQKKSLNDKLLAGTREMEPLPNKYYLSEAVIIF